MPQEFAGIDEKLKRTDENIRNLETEISRFFQDGKYPIVPEHDRELLLEAIHYHKNRVIPLRFSVLAGEIVHHLRSCLDHLIWIFSDLNLVKNSKRIEFPIFEHPLDKDSISLYEGKVKGITNPAALKLIESLQPYNCSDPLDDALFIIHSFDIIDKHRELVLCLPTGAREFPPENRGFVADYQRQHPEFSPEDFAIKLKSYGKLVPQISFKDFGRRTIQPVIPALTQLHDYVGDVVRKFAAI